MSELEVPLRSWMALDDLALELHEESVRAIATPVVVAELRAQAVQLGRAGWTAAGRTLLARADELEKELTA